MLLCVVLGEALLGSAHASKTYVMLSALVHCSRRFRILGNLEPYAALYSFGCFVVFNDCREGAMIIHACTHAFL